LFFILKIPQGVIGRGKFTGDQPPENGGGGEYKTKKERGNGARPNKEKLIKEGVFEKKVKKRSSKLLRIFPE